MPQKHWLDYITFSLELLGLLVLCIYAGYTIKIYCANKKSADAAFQAAVTAGKQLEVSTRPWIEVEPMFSNPKSLNGFYVILTNHGNSPAILGGMPHFVLGDLNKGEARMWTQPPGGKDVCDYVERMPGVDGVEGWARFPIPVFQNRPLKLQPAIGTGNPHTNSRDMYDYLSGCVVYRGASGGPYKTRVIYHIVYAPDHSISKVEDFPYVDAF